MEGSTSRKADETRLLVEAASGNSEAAAILLDDYLPIVYGFIWPRVGGHQEIADDLLQETVLEAIKYAKSFRGEASLSTWLCAIARRRIFRFFERERKEAAAAAGLSLVTDEDATFEAERREELTAALGRVPIIHRQVLVMKYLDDMTVDEIGKVLGRTRTQVQSLLQRARGNLRKELADG